MARPRKNLTPKLCEAMEDLLENGSSVGYIAKQFEMSETTLRAIVKRDRRAELHWQWGRGKRETWLWRQLHDPTVKNKTPTIYELKSRFGYTDVPKQSPDDFQNRVEVTFQLPKPLSEGEYRKLIDVTPPRALADAGVEAEPNAG